MFHLKLLELESELIAKEQSSKGLKDLSPACKALIEFVEKEVQVHLAEKVPSDWRGWLTYKRNGDSLIICRGQAFSEGGLFGGKFRAGLAVPYGLDTVTEYQRHFDVSPPAELDHLLLNFGNDENPKVFLWYGENLAHYKLIYTADVADDPHEDLGNAVVEALTWVLKRPKEITLLEFLKGIERQQA